MIMNHLLRTELDRPGSLRVRMVSTGVALVAAVCWTSRPADARPAQSSPITQHATAYVDAPPSSLVEVGDAAKELFDAARLSNWSDADVALQALKTSGAALPTKWSTPDLASQLVSHLAEVESSVSARLRVQTMELANGITRLVADLSSQYQMSVPYALVLLDYYGRELELGIAAGDQVRLARATADLQQTWNRFERTVLQRGAVDDARRFTDIVAQLVDAHVPGDFVAPTRAELAAVDALKRLFKP
jgi:hypothetical protein